MKKLFYCLLIVLNSFAVDYYISPSGSDSTGNGSIGNPWRTIDEAEGNASPGDFIFARGGVYSNTKSYIRCDGIPNIPIHFVAYPGETPIFDGENVEIGENQSILLLYEANNIIVDGFEVRNSSGRGISVSESTNVIIKNCKAHEISSRGIGCSGFNISIISNEVWNCCLANFQGAFGSGGWAAGISSAKIWSTGEMSSNIIIRGNYVHDNWGEGIIAMKTRNIFVENNNVKNNYSVLIYVGGTCNVSVRNNYLCVTTNLYDRVDNGSRANGINMAIETTVSLPVTNVVIANNLVMNTSKGVGFWFDSSNTSSNNFYSDVKIWHNTFVSNYYAIKINEVPFETENNVFQNNIVVGGIFNVANSSSWTFSHNCWAEGVPAQADESNSFAADPEFINPEIGGAAEGYKVLVGSPVVFKGTPVSEIVVDYWNNSRNVTAPTLGFFEQVPEPEFIWLIGLLPLIFKRVIMVMEIEVNSSN